MKYLVKLSGSLFIGMAAVVMMLAARPALAENTNQTISGLATSDQGGAGTQQTIQLDVLQGMSQGQASPVEQYIYTNLVFNSCAKGVVDNQIGQYDSYQKASGEYQSLICDMYNCYQEAMLVSMLSTSSNNTSTGGQSTQTAQCQMQQNIQNYLATAQGNQNCPGSFPTELLQVIANPGNGSSGSSCN